MLEILKQQPLARVAAVAALVLLLAPALLAQKLPEPSGFLGDYSKLQEDPKEKARLVYSNPAYKMSDFQALYLEEPVMMVYPQDEAETIDADKASKMLRLVQRFDDVLRVALEEQGANLVYDAGPGVLHCRWAITNLGKSKSAMRALPQARLAGAGRGGAAMEGECVDGGSGKVVAQVVRADKGARKSGVTTWAGAESAIREWAGDLAARLAAKRM